MTLELRRRTPLLHFPTSSEASLPVLSPDPNKLHISITHVLPNPLYPSPSDPSEQLIVPPKTLRVNETFLRRYTSPTKLQCTTLDHGCCKMLRMNRGFVQERDLAFCCAPLAMFRLFLGRGSIRRCGSCGREVVDRGFFSLQREFSDARAIRVPTTT